jgi:hypothetical protein
MQIIGHASTQPMPPPSTTNTESLWLSAHKRRLWVATEAGGGARTARSLQLAESSKTASPTTTYYYYYYYTTATRATPARSLQLAMVADA